MKNFNTFINKLKKKDLAALDFLVENYSNIIFKVCDGILNNRELSKECTNEVLLKIWENIGKFNKEKSKFIVWLIAISKYTAIDKLRKESKHYNHSNIAELNLSSSQNLEDDTFNNKDLENAKSIKLIALAEPFLPANIDGLSDTDINEIKSSTIDELIIR
ncbi:MAG: sigma factor [Sarcina sp.]